MSFGECPHVFAAVVGCVLSKATLRSSYCHRSEALSTLSQNEMSFPDIVHFIYTSGFVETSLSLTFDTILTCSGLFSLNEADELIKIASCGVCSRPPPLHKQVSTGQFGSGKLPLFVLQPSRPSGEKFDNYEWVLASLRLCGKERESRSL